MQKLTASSLVVGVAALALLAVASFSTSPAHAEEFSRAVGVPLTEAQDAIKKKPPQWDVALARTKAAQAVKDKKPNEEYAINEMLGYVYNNLKRYAEAIKAYEANLNSGRMPAAEQPARVEMLAGMYLQAGNTAKALEYGNRWLKASPNDGAAALFVANIQYENNDCKSASRNLQTAINAATKSGQPPKESWLKLKLTCQHDLNDKDGMTDTRELLVRYYPNKGNWDNLLTPLCNDPERTDDRAKSNCYHLMLELDVLKKADVYDEMAQIALENGMPHEAVSILQKGFDNKVLETDRHKDRHVRLMNQAKAQAQAAQNDLAAISQKAAADPKGDGDLKLAAALMSVGQYDKAVGAIQRSIKKGLKNTDEAQMMLGRAYLKLNRKDDARKAFSAVPDYSRLAHVAGLWKVYAQQG